MFEVETVSSKYERFNIRWGMKVTLYKYESWEDKAALRGFYHMVWYLLREELYERELENKDI